VLVERSPGDVPAATCIGRDPVVTGTTTALDAGAFTRRAAVVESPDGVHDLALHDVRYDATSRRWFADIVVDTPMYRPFLRLVLARYQVDSVAGQELSSSVTLDPIRLGVNRTVRVRASASATDEFDVIVSGPDHGGMTADDGTATLLTNELVVVHQRADATVVDADLRWRIDVSTARLPRVSTNGVSTWSATIAAPADGAPRRLVIEEREPALTGLVDPTVGGETVYTETVELPA
jgi:hypothetical protein